MQNFGYFFINFGELALKINFVVVRLERAHVIILLLESEEGEVILALLAHNLKDNS